AVLGDERRLEGHDGGPVTERAAGKKPLQGRLHGLLGGEVGEEALRVGLVAGESAGHPPRGRRGPEPPAGSRGEGPWLNHAAPARVCKGPRAKARGEGHGSRRYVEVSGLNERGSHSGRRSPSGPGAGRAMASQCRYTSCARLVSTNTSP